MIISARTIGRKSNGREAKSRNAFSGKIALMPNLVPILAFICMIELALSVPACAAETKNNPSNNTSIESRLEELEMSLFRLVYEKDTVDARLNRIESLMYGAPRSGAPQDRVQSVEKDLFNPYSASALPIGRKKYEPTEPEKNTSQAAANAQSNQLPASGNTNYDIRQRAAAQSNTASGEGGGTPNAAGVQGSVTVNTTGSASRSNDAATAYGASNPAVTGSTAGPTSPATSAVCDSGEGAAPATGTLAQQPIDIMPVMTPPPASPKATPAPPAGPVTLPGTRISFGGDGPENVLVLKKDMFVQPGEDPKAKISEISRVLRQDPLDALIPDLYFERAKAEIALSEYTRAKNDLDEAIRNSPMRANLYLARAFCHNALKEAMLAREDIARARFADQRLPKSIEFDGN